MDWREEYARWGVHYRVQGSAGIVTVRGGIGNDPWDCDVSPDQLVAAIARAAEDASTTTGILELDCPGGEIGPWSEIDGALARWAGAKELHAIARHEALSLAYWMTTHAQTVVATSTAMVGSIGVLLPLTDDSVAAERAGVRVVPITDSPAKTAGLRGVPIDDVHVASEEAALLPVGRRFREAVATARGLSVDAVAALGGRHMYGPEALGAGLVDEVVNAEEWIERIASGPAAGRGARPPERPAAGNTGKPAAGAAAAGTSKEPTMATKKKPAVAMTVDELVKKHPDREAEIMGKVSEMARAMDEDIENDGQDDGAGAGAEVEEDDEAAAEGGTDDQAAAQEGDDEEQGPVAQGKPAAKPAAKAPRKPAAQRPASIDELEGLGKGDKFVVAAAKAKLTLPAATAMAGAWTGTPAARGGGGGGGGGGAKGSDPVAGVIGGAPAAGDGGEGADEYLELVAKAKAQRGKGEYDAIQWVRKEHPEAHKRHTEADKANRMARQQANMRRHMPAQA